MTRSAKTPFHSPRSFQLWHYGIGHKELVLRSQAGGQEPETLDIVFETVRAMKLHTHYPTLTIRSATPEERKSIREFSDGGPGELSGVGHYYLVLESERDPAFVVCRRVEAYARPGAEADYRITASTGRLVWAGSRA
ncbi:MULTISPECIES: hypothetical protein [Streptomycetaceae]|uniref:hypothetical protein n=1 Tax=Streptomycetaceae TaxID=2062 RepID=UPI00093E5ADD|nr:hypothetical protein [Streptomyces sp. CB02056]